MKLFVVEHRGTGGMIHYAYQLSTAMANQGISVHLITSTQYELDDYPHNFTVQKVMRLWPQFDPLLETQSHSFISRAFTMAFWNTRRLLRGIRYLFEWNRLTNFILRENPDVVQFGEIGFPFELIFLRRLKRKGLVLTQICHEFQARDKGEGLWEKWAANTYLEVYQTFSMIFFHGKTIRDLFLTIFPIPPERIHIIPHGNEQIFQQQHPNKRARVEILHHYGFSEENPIILLLGSLTPSKGIPILLDAFSKVIRENQFGRLLIAGLPSKYIKISEYIDLAKSLGLQGKVYFDTRYIPIEEVGELVELATVVVYPYLSATQSGSLQLAYAFGRPVIATSVGGLPDAVDHGKSGFIIPPNSSDELANAILQLINSPHLAKEMGQYAKNLSETRFAWGPIAKQMLDLYQDILSET